MVSIKSPLLQNPLLPLFYNETPDGPRSESVREAERERGRVVVGGERVCERESARARERESESESERESARERARARARERARERG